MNKKDNLIVLEDGVKVILAPAKVNFGLWVKGKRTDGYHDIFSIIHTIDLYDRIYIEPHYTLEVLSVGPFSKNLKDNIVYEGVLAFSRLTGKNFDYKIVIEKNIPVGAGLGGASSDLAAVISYLNEELENPMEEQELAEFLSSFSKDAPFFLKGGCALVYGTGDQVKVLEPISREITIVYPNVEASTSKVYGAFTKQTEEVLSLEDILRLLEENDIENIIENHLQETAIEIYKEIGELIRFLESVGYKPYMSGSGSSVYVFGKLSDKIKMALESRGWYVYECKTI
jgi:4-diphosphocytidyl-2-C-methyl-D-erythritol kinase